MLWLQLHILQYQMTLMVCASMALHTAGKVVAAVTSATSTASQQPQRL
jgi:hypothetical protein